jgi:hypothetical protein
MYITSPVKSEPPAMMTIKRPTGKLKPKMSFIKFPQAGFKLPVTFMASEAPKPI